MRLAAFAAPSTSFATCTATSSTASAGLVSVAPRETFDASGVEQAKERLGSVLERFHRTVSKVAELLEAAEEDLLAVSRFPSAHWPKLRSTNPLEPFGKEIGHRSDGRWIGAMVTALRSAIDRAE